jgi:teichuronic acid biosynthesis glycosyltransferase TuaC
LFGAPRANISALLPTSSEASRPRILSITTVYPNSVEPGLGPFVKARLEHLAQYADIKVIAPVPLIDYSRRKIGLLHSRAKPLAGTDSVEVLHPYWLYPPSGTPLNIFFLCIRLLPLIFRLRRSFDFNMIDAHFGYPEGAAAALLASIFRVPFMVTLRGSETMFAAYPARRKWIQRSLRKAAAVIAVSENLRQFAIAEGAAAERVRTIPNGVDTDVFFARDRRRLREERGLIADHKVIVSAGELIEAKGHHLVIQSVAKLVAADSSIRLLIVGKTGRGGVDYESELRNLVGELGLESFVTFIGWVDKNGLADLFSVADVFCLASYTEGWPNVVHEALSCGAPVVVTAVGGARALVPDVQYGSVVPVKDVEALTAALAASLNKQWNRQAIAAWGQSRNWTHVAREVIAVVDEIRSSSLPARLVMERPEEALLKRN